MYSLGPTAVIKVHGTSPIAGQEAVVLKNTSSGSLLNGANGAVHNGSVSHTNGTTVPASRATDGAKTLRVGIVLSGGQAPGQPCPLLLFSEARFNKPLAAPSPHIAARRHSCLVSAAKAAGRVPSYAWSECFVGRPIGFSIIVPDSFLQQQLIPYPVYCHGAF